MAKKISPPLVITIPQISVSLKSTAMREINKNVRTGRKVAGRKVLILDVNDDYDYKKVISKKSDKKKLLLTRKTKKSKK